MSVSEDQIEIVVGAAGVTDLVFDEKNQERQSWRFCNSRLPRSEVDQISLFYIDCEESTFWFSLYSCRVEYALPNPKL